MARARSLTLHPTAVSEDSLGCDIAHLQALQHREREEDGNSRKSERTHMWQTLKHTRFEFLEVSFRGIKMQLIGTPSKTGRNVQPAEIYCMFANVSCLQRETVPGEARVSPLNPT